MLLAVSCGTPAGAGVFPAAREMRCLRSGEWQLEICLEDGVGDVCYKYILADAAGVETEEPFAHRATFDGDYGSYVLRDVWQSEAEELMFYTSAFTENLYAPRRDAPCSAASPRRCMEIRLAAPEVRPGQALAVAGNQPCLGNWRVERAPRLSVDRFPQWEIRIDAGAVVFPLEYKFVVVDGADGRLCYWEDGENRVIPAPAGEGGCRVSDFPLRAAGRSWKACGTVVPVFSLRSEESFGIGDFGDIRKLIDWAKLTGQHFLQFLPVNDTTCSHTWRDSYPYSAVSVYALHPLYINIPTLGALNDRTRMAFFDGMRRRLNEGAEVDYPEVERIKSMYYREYFTQERDNILMRDDFTAFAADNMEWLLPYAAFSYLRDMYHTPDCAAWGEYAAYDRGRVERLYGGEREAFLYLFFIQYTLHTQFESVAAYARRNGVALKGDLPIGVNRLSVETWTDPAYFNMQGQSGAPPDDFAATGQNWSFPTYNWEAMERDGFGWWKKRLRRLNCYFDAIRVDHILGFFRIWEIPADCMDGLCGHFRPALPLSKAEIEGYGMRFSERWTKPCIHTRFLPDIAASDCYPYLTPLDDGHLTLKPHCSTQRKISSLCDGVSQTVREGLMRIACEVLFLEDPYEAERYHPRILAHRSYAYRELPDADRSAFDRLYHDFYFVRHNHFWKETALHRLAPLIKRDGMLICGEDLGMIPASVHEVMNSLQLFSLEIERMPKVAGREFADLKTLPRRSVCTTSTHDMPPLRVWWEEDEAKTRRYCRDVLQDEGKAPAACSPEMAERIIGNHLQSSSMLTILPLQDWMSIDGQIRRPDAAAERINIPADPDHYWRYRMHVTLETLLHADTFNQKIIRLIAAHQ
jgi:4-alpha-glucanotransferase